MQQILAQLWTRFSTEYVTQLQKRYKNKFPQRNVAIGDIVILKDETTKPTEWKMGKITAVHPDRAGHIRNVELKTSSKENVVRAVTRLVPLLSEAEEREQQDQQQRNLQSIPRTPSRQTNLAVRVLLTWFALTSSSTDALAANPIQPGVYVQLGAQVQVHAFGLEFRVQTNLNVSHDLEFIDQKLRKFTEMCNVYAKEDKDLES